MSMTPESANVHAHKPAVTCCRFEAGTMIGPENLEDPTVLPALIDSGFIRMPDHCLAISEVNQRGDEKCQISW
jgi:D-proline reductase (dithiol) PrdA